MTAFLPGTTIHDLSVSTLNAITATCLGGLAIGLSAGVSAYGGILALVGSGLLLGGMAVLVVQHCSAMRSIRQKETMAQAFEEAQPEIRAAERALANILALYLEMARPHIPPKAYANGMSFLTLRPNGFDPQASEIPVASVDLLVSQGADGALSGSLRQDLMLCYIRLLERHIGAEMAAVTGEHLHRRLITLLPMSQHERLTAYPEARRLFERHGAGQ